MSEFDPSSRSSPPRRRADRPIQPNSTAPPGPQPTPFSVVPDDDRVDVPPPSPEDFLRPHPPAKPRAFAHAKSVGLRRTLVPLLLTHGIFLPILGALWFTTAVDSPFRRLGIFAPISLFIAGGILLILGIANVLYLKSLQQKTGRL